MFLAEPPQSEYDLNFQFAGIQVRVHPWFWLVTAIMGANGIQRMPNAGVALVTWIGVVFVSILIHELGHSLAMRYYGLPSHIVLYSMGGLAIQDSTTRRNWLTQVIISLAGPGAGFAFAAAVVTALKLTGKDVSFDFGLPFLVDYDIEPFRPANLMLLVHYLLFVNIYWGIVNLLPVYPLDGGQAARAILEQHSRDGLRQSLYLSIITAAVVAYFALMRRDTYVALMFGLLAFNNYQMLQSFNGPGRWRY